MADMPCAAEAPLLSRAVAQPRRRRRPRPAAAPHRHGAAHRFGIPAASHRRLHAELGRLRGAGQDLRPRRRHGPHGDARQGDPRRARRRAGAAARRRRRAAGLLHGACNPRAATWSRAAGAGRRGDHRALGVHAGRASASPSCSATWIRPAPRAWRSWPATCATPTSRSRFSTPRACSRRAASASR